MAATKESNFPESSAISAARYFSRTHRLEVTFRSGSAYLYYDILPRIFEEFRMADSKGRYFHEHILHRYRYDRLK